MLMGVLYKTRAWTCILQFLVKMGTHATTLVQLPAMKTKSIAIMEWIGMAAGREVIAHQVGMNALLLAGQVAMEIQ